MISFNYECDFLLDSPDQLREWLSKIIQTEDKKEGDLNYIFCDDLYLHKLNMEYLNHDTLTDIISFDYSLGNRLNGDIYISVERVEDNAKDFNTEFREELRRVMAHGILHYCGYKDKIPEDEAIMRNKEDTYLRMFAETGL